MRQPINTEMDMHSLVTDTAKANVYGDMVGAAILDGEFRKASGRKCVHMETPVMRKIKPC